VTHELLAIGDARKKPVADGESGLCVDMTEVDQPTVNGRTWSRNRSSPLLPLHLRPAVPAWPWTLPPAQRLDNAHRPPVPADSSRLLTSWVTRTGSRLRIILGSTMGLIVCRSLRHGVGGLGLSAVRIEDADREDFCGDGSAAQGDQSKVSCSRRRRDGHGRGCVVHRGGTCSPGPRGWSQSSPARPFRPTLLPAPISGTCSRLFGRRLPSRQT